MLIGREREKSQILELYESKQAEFLALYGRRRVGKTVLVRESFISCDSLYFELTGQKKMKLAKQLSNFVKAYQKTFYPKLKIMPPKTWSEAFGMLTDAINKTDKKVVIFLDELPWLAGRKSNLMSALDYVWNTEWVKCPRVKLIVCGSAASWMIKHIISDKGGLHNRTTDTMLLKPFTLTETKYFLAEKNITLSLIQILQIYMTMGGIPYYLNLIKSGKSATEIISTLCFQENGLLFNEFDKLFDSLFDDSEVYKEIIRIVASKRYGIEKRNLLKQAKFSTSGGRFNVRLNELVEAGFIKRMIQNKKNEEYYRIIDEYSYFYLKWILPMKDQLLLDNVNQYWQLQMQTSSWKSWAGYTFETICLKHANKLIEKLELSSLVIGAIPWRFISNKNPNENESNGAQIDLILQRNDGSVTLCEIKFNLKEIIIDKTFRANLLNKVAAYRKTTKIDEHVFIVMVTCAGVKKNNYAKELLADQLVLADLFE